jgi:transcriptional regulator with XRE-family HTH domain
VPVSLRVKELRQAKGWRQVDLAERSGIDQGNISKIEQGQTRGVDFATLEKLADALGVDAGFLIVHERTTKRRK